MRSLLLLALGACPLLAPEAGGNRVPATVVVEPSLPSHTLSDGTLLHLQTFGDPGSPVLIVLHGGPGSDYRSYETLEALSDELFVVLWDQRDAGPSQHCPDEDLDGPTYLDDLDELVQTFSPDHPVSLLGHSWGGAYASYYAANFPEKVDHLVLVEPGALSVQAAEAAHGGGMSISEADLNRFVMASDYLYPDSYAEQDYVFTILLTATESLEDFASEDELGALPFWRSGFSANLGINAWQGNFDVPTFDLSEDLAAYTGPTLLLGGTESERLDYAFQSELQAPLFNEVDLVKVEGAGHYMLRFNADTVLPTIRDFLIEGDG